MRRRVNKIALQPTRSCPRLGIKEICRATIKKEASTRITRPSLLPSQATGSTATSRNWAKLIEAATMEVSWAHPLPLRVKLKYQWTYRELTRSPSILSHLVDAKTGTVGTTLTWSLTWARAATSGLLYLQSMWEVRSTQTLAYQTTTGRFLVRATRLADHSSHQDDRR